MSYYKLLGLDREPFSTSPDPYFFYASHGHRSALTRLEMNIRLRRGLSLIIGDVGMGKTVLCRVLAQRIQEDEDLLFYLLLDPDFENKEQFVRRLHALFKVRSPSGGILWHKESIERFLFREGVEKKKTVVLVIDEGQKLSLENLELLRTFLNYETNECKLLQLVIMAQLELVPRLKEMRNFLDRASTLHILQPFDEAQTKEMIEFRLRQAGYSGRHSLFSDEAVALIHHCSGGFPRRIAMACHHALKGACARGKAVIEADDIEALSNASYSIA